MCRKNRLRVSCVMIVQYVLSYAVPVVAGVVGVVAIIAVLLLILASIVILLVLKR